MIAVKGTRCRRRQSALARLFPGKNTGAVVNAITLFLTILALFAAQGCTRSREEGHALQVAERVRTEFLHAWDNYERYAWGHDALRPLSKTPHDWYGQSLQMTPDRK